jgi:PHD finger-like domain-containing protein 5A
MARHHTDLSLCRKQPGVAIGKVCDRCDGKCVICDSYANMTSIVRICDDCNYGTTNLDKCILCSAKAENDAYYCRECVMLEKDRDGCPKVVNLGTAKKDKHHSEKQFSASAAMNLAPS